MPTGRMSQCERLNAIGNLPGRGCRMLSELSDNFADRVEELFHQALELEPATQAEFLTAACHDEPHLKSEVENLLSAWVLVHNTPGWEVPAIQNEAWSVAAGVEDLTLDRYKLLDRIGWGGMGAVFRAQRADDEFSKLVAIKILHSVPPGPDRDRMFRRFRLERQILAKLEHPNIARLLDGGSTVDRLPFIVMEYVEGVPINRFVV